MSRSEKLGSISGSKEVGNYEKIYGTQKRGVSEEKDIKGEGFLKGRASNDKGFEREGLWKRGTGREKGLIKRLQVLASKTYPQLRPNALIYKPLVVTDQTGNRVLVTRWCGKPRQYVVICGSMENDVATDMVDGITKMWQMTWQLLGTQRMHDQSNWNKSNMVGVVGGVSKGCPWPRILGEEEEAMVVRTSLISCWLMVVNIFDLQCLWDFFVTMVIGVEDGNTNLWAFSRTSTSIKWGSFSFTCSTYKYNTGDINRIGGHAVDTMVDFMCTISFRTDNDIDSDKTRVISCGSRRVGILHTGKKSKFMGELNLPHHLINIFWTKIGMKFSKWIEYCHDNIQGIRE